MMSRMIVFHVDEKPSLSLTILAGAQHVLTLFGATTLVPLIFGPAMRMSEEQIATFICCVYFGMGVATLIQTWPRTGSGLPIVQGSSFSFIPPIMTIIGLYEVDGPNVIMQYVGGSLLIGGIGLALIGYTGIVGKIRKLITPIVIGPTIMAIGFSLAGTAVDNASSYWPVAILTVVVVFFCGLASKNKYSQIFCVLIAIASAYLTCLIFTMAGVFTGEHSAYVDIASISNAPWFRGDIIMPWGPPKFSVAAIGAVAAGFLCVMIESIGDYHSCAIAAGMNSPSEKQISRGIGAEGVGCALSGMLGSVGTTSYTENIGLIAITGVASRHVVRAGAVILIIISFVGKIGALIATIPKPVIGGAYITLFGTIGAIGIQTLLRGNMRSQRNVMIVGFAFLMSQGIPGWADANQAQFVTALGETMGSTIWAIMKTPMAVAAICAVMGDSLIPGTDEERGI